MNVTEKELLIKTKNPMKHMRLFIQKFFSIFGFNEDPEEQTEVQASPNLKLQPINKDNQVSVAEETVADDTMINTDTLTTEQNSVTFSSKKSIEFTEIEPIAIKVVPSSDNEFVQEVNVPDGHFDKLLATTIDTIKYYDQIAEQVQNQDAKTLLNDVCAKLIENLILSGCTPINKPTGKYDMMKHKIIPFQIVPEGTVYTNLVRPGIEYDGEVKILAIVEI